MDPKAKTRFYFCSRFASAADRMMSSDVHISNEDELYIQNLRRQKHRKRTKDGMSAKR